MIVVDASVWISGIMATDVHHDATVAWQRSLSIQGQTMFVPGLLIPEVAGAITRITGLPSAGYRVIEAIVEEPNTCIVEIDNALVMQAASIAVECTLKGADALYVALARTLDVPLVTWDREQLLRSKGLIETTEPVLKLGLN